MKKKDLLFCLSFCIIAPLIEWSYGALWGAVGTAPWHYPNAPLVYTSWEVIPIYGFGAYFMLSFARFWTKPRWLLVPRMIIPLMLGGVWVVAYVLAS